MTRRRIAGLAFVVGLAACGGGEATNDTPLPDSGAVNDANPGCTVFLTFDPPMGVAGNQIRAIANVLNASGVLSYTWEVKYENAPVVYQAAQADNSQVMFAAPNAGVYQVSVSVDAPGQGCPTDQIGYNVASPNSNSMQVRLRVTPPGNASAPPQERLYLVTGGGGTTLNSVPVDPGVIATGNVRAGTTDVPAYLRFIPLGYRDAYVETFTTNAGAFSARVLNVAHDVLVVPTIPGFAPRLVTNWFPGTTLIAATAGTAVSGFVAGPGGGGLDGAKVQITVDGVPSTLATTTNGNFTVRSIATANVEATVDVTPPPASGLPRISATSSALNLATAVQVQYANLALRDLAGVTVRRAATAVPNAAVIVVGTLVSAATVTTGATAVPASGIVRVAATANASGQLPARLAPAAPLFAVTTVAAGDLAVTSLDLTAGVPSQIDAPAMTTVSSQITKPDLAPIAEAVFEAVPIGPLALAGVGAIRVTSRAGGAVTLALPAGGRYDVRVSDPQGRGAVELAPNLAPSAIAASYTLKPALRVLGQLQLQGAGSPVGNATVQIMCTACTGLDRSRPLGETSSTSSGAFDVAMPDPGTQ